MNASDHRKAEEVNSQRTFGLIAHLKSIKFTGALKHKRDYSTVFYVDDEEFSTDKQPSPHWQEDRQFWFKPSSSMKIIFYESEGISGFFGGSRLLGQYVGRVVELLEKGGPTGLTNETGAPVEIRMEIKLSLVSAQGVVEQVYANTGRLDNSKFVGVSSHFDTGTSIVQAGYGIVQALSPFIAPLGQTLQLISNIMDKIADAHPILKVSWIVLSSIHKAFQYQLLQDEMVRGLADKLREMVGVANACPNLLEIKNTTNVIEEIGRITLRVASLIDEYAKPSLSGRIVASQLSGDMKSRIDKCSDSCDDLMKKFGLRVNIGVSKKVDDIEVAINQNHTELLDKSRAEKIYEWLDAPDPSRNYNAACKKHVAGTCGWFINGKLFADWKETADTFIWVHGIPGCGKTILSSVIISDLVKHCSEDASQAIAYFFFDSRDSQAALQLHENFIRSLIRQFSAQYGDIPDALGRLYGDGHYQPPIGALHKILQQLIHEFKHSFIVIDSLDECADREELLNWITDIISWKGGNLHLLASSRDEQDIKEHIQALQPISVYLEGGPDNCDIEAYIDTMLQPSGKFKRWNQQPKVREDIKDGLMKASQGMFRLVALQLDDLENCPTVHAVKTQLRSLPQTLEGHYDRILSKISQKCPEDGTKFLQWIAFSACPLSISQLAFVVAVDFESKDRPCYDPERQYPNPMDVLAMCSSLVTVSDGYVKLAHLSVKEYLISKDIQKGASSSFSIDEKGSHSLISQTCLAYLLQFNSPHLTAGDIIYDFPLAQYAAEYWIHHAVSADLDCSPVLQELIMNLLQHDIVPYRIWVQLQRLDTWNWKQSDPSHFPPPLYYASLAGLHCTSQTLLEKGTDVNTSGGQHGNALQAASHNGHQAIVSLLLEKGAMVNAQGGFHGSALQAACHQGHQGIVELLLEKGAELKTQQGQHHYALKSAACGGHLPIVKLLLEKGADINFQENGFNALHVASANGRLAVVDLLLEMGAMINDQRNGFSALHVASGFGYLGVVELLLRRGASIDALGEAGTALHVATVGGHQAIVDLLLEKGADAKTHGEEIKLQAVGPQSFMSLVGNKSSGGKAAGGS